MGILRQPSAHEGQELGTITPVENGTLATRFGSVSLRNFPTLLTTEMAS